MMLMMLGKHFAMMRKKKNSRSNKICHYNTKLFLVYIFLAASFLLRATTTIITTTTTAVTPSNSSNQVTQSGVVTKECTSIDIRNDCASLLLLENCTVVIGYVMLTLLPHQFREKCNYDNYRFPLLREITDFMILHEVKGLTTVRSMFPNLTVIRGRRLFLNYALGVTSMPDLEFLEFPSLVAIQRGHVYVGPCPKLCQLERINWDRLTLTSGENHIIKKTELMSSKCKQRAECKGCPTDYCWSNFACQKFENDNIHDLWENIYHCHEQCLGGCHSSNNNRDCVVCKGLTDHGACVEKCPQEKFLMDHFQRCYTRDECISLSGHYTHEFECVSYCPSGYKANQTTMNCDPCTQDEACISTCTPEYNEAMTIYNLADSDTMQGCQIVNGSLVITIRSHINEKDLIRNFASLREIRGHLKIYRSSHLTSLKFLSNLRRIYGDPLENDHFALIIYDNKNITDLWLPENFELKRGGIYIHSNNKLCNRNTLDFRDRIDHDKSLDSLQTSDQEVLCGPAKLNLQLEALSQNKLLLSWRKDQTNDEIEIIYRPVVQGNQYSVASELDAPICTRINWQHDLLFRSQLKSKNSTHYSYIIDNLEQNTKYSCLVKTFGNNVQINARSELEYITTHMDKPTAPNIKITKKTDSSITIQILQQNHSLETIDYFNLNVYELSDDKELIDKRNFCKEPTYLQQDMESYGANFRYDDYDECCIRQAELRDDLQFMDNMRKEYNCNLEHTAEHCSTKNKASATPFLTIRLESNDTSYTLNNLHRYRLYTLELQACNNIGCGTYSMHSERTNYTRAGDQLSDLSACQAPHSDQYQVSFSEPEQPNGAIVSYVIHFRVYVPNVDFYESYVNCVTRSAHAESNYVYIGQLNTSYSECAVRVHSLAGDVLTPWVNITTCTKVLPTRAAGAGIPDTEHTDNVNVFLVFFFSGAGGTTIWVFYKRRCWRKIPEIRRYLRLDRNVRATWVRGAVPTGNHDDQEILVEGFENVQFQNNLDDS